MPEAQLGLDAKLYRNTGTYAAPVWDEITAIRDAKVNMSFAEADVTTRGSNKVRQLEPTLLELAIETELLWRNNNLDCTALYTAAINRAPLDLRAMDMNGGIGVRCDWKVFGFDRDEPLEEGQKVDLTLKPCSSNNPVQFVDDT